MAIPNPDECRMIAAGLLNEAHAPGNSNPDWALARSMNAIGYLLLGESQGDMEARFNPEDAAEWTPPDADAIPEVDAALDDLRRRHPSRYMHSSADVP